MLTPRLEAILRHIKSDTAADIGTDHAYVPIELIKQKRALRVIASDIKPGPVKIAAQNIEKHGLSDKIEVREGPGLSILSENEADTIIIAGMGGEMIEKIIRDDYDTAILSRLVLQPMNSQYELRHYLLENGFLIEKEDISVEGFKVYNLIIARAGTSKPFLKDIHYHIPPYLKAHPLYGALYDKKKRELSRVIAGLEASKSCDEEKLLKYKTWLGELMNESI
ncbi:MAG: class I SAM-dependent methyltransferase [Clostridiales bacterium]|nr:class I SAM-dependent methyltransferase [Clostridiales bacterium]